MRSRKRARSLIAITVSGVLLLGAGMHAAEDAPTRRALLIGINEYQVLPDLRGAVNDLTLIEQVLTTRFGFPAENIQRLTDSDATRERLLETMRSFVASTGPRDQVYIHYSGHGSQVADADGDEEDERDETLVPHDGRSAGVPDITDDELAEIFAGLTTPSAVIALDSCHSGTATRDVSAFRARFVPADDRVELYGKLRTRAIVPVPESRYVVLTGAASNQKALDGPVEGNSHGLFSFSLAKSLGSADPGATPIEVFRGIEQELERIKGQLGLYNMPEPQLEGPTAKLEAAFLAAPAEVAEAGGEATAAYLESERLESGRIRLNGAHPQAEPGSIWALYPDDETSFEPGAALAEITVVAADGDGVQGEVSSGPADLPKKGRVILVAAAPPPASVAVQVEGPAELGNALQEAIEEQLPEVEFVTEEEDFARFYVDLEEDGAVVFGADHEQELKRFENPDPDALATELVGLFSRSMTVAELLSLENPHSGIELDVSITRLGAPAEGARVAEAHAPEFRIRRPEEPRGDRNSLQIDVRANRDCYVTVLDVDAEGRVSAVFPNPLSEARGYASGGQLKAGATLRIPDSLAPDNRAGFYADFAPPAGIDTLRVFCNADAETADLIREAVAELSTATRSATRDVVVGRLRVLLAPSRTRGLRIVASEEVTETAGPGEARDWTAASLTLRVVDPAP